MWYKLKLFKDLKTMTLSQITKQLISNSLTEYANFDICRDKLILISKSICMHIYTLTSYLHIGNSQSKEKTHINIR